MACAQKKSLISSLTLWQAMIKTVYPASVKEVFVLLFD